MKFTATVTFLLFGFRLFAQQKDTVLILPGSKTLQSNQLRDYTASYDFFQAKDGEEKLVGSLEDNFQVHAGTKGKEALRICKIIFGTNNIIDSGGCQLKGLVPLYHRSSQTKKTLDLVFSKEKVTGKIVSKTDNKVEPIDHQTASPLFDSYYEDILAKTVNLERGVIFRFPEYIYEKGGTVWSLGEVLRGEHADERIVKFYELDANKRTVRTTTYHIHESTRDIVRREYQMGNNRIIMKRKQS